MGKLDTAYGPFVELMAQGRIYVVPDYQRPYSWKPKKQVAELWGDISRLYRGRQSTPEQVDSHFIGSVVIGSAATKALGPVQAPVIDGQQRLVTLSLVLCAIRDVLVKDASSARDINDQYLVHYKNDEIRDFRVQPGSFDRGNYEALVRGVSSYDNKSNVYRAYRYVVDQLNAGPELESDPDDAEEGEPSDVDGAIEDVVEEVISVTPASWDWETLVEVVGSQLELVSISDVPAEQAYGIFASLNSTGLPLAQVDLIRNAIFMLLPRAGQKVHREYWEPLESELGRESLQHYFHAWVMLRGHNVPAKDTYRSVVRELAAAGVSEKDVVAAVRGIYDEAWSYLLITQPLTGQREKFSQAPNPKTPASLTRALARLRAWGTTPMEPVLLRLVSLWRSPGSNFTTPQLLSCLADLESYAVRRFMSHVPPNDLRSIYARITQQLVTAKQQSPGGVLRSALLEPSRRWPSNDQLTDSLLKRPLYRSPGQAQTFFVLKTIAEKLEGKECPQIQLGTSATSYSIEHVLPQSLSEDWAKDMKAWGEEQPHKAWQEYRHTLGNLTLTAYNSELWNWPLDVKQEWIEEHLRLKLSKQLLAVDRWTSLEITTRSQELAKLAVTLWKHP